MSNSWDEIKRLGREKLERKQQRMRNLLKIAVPDEALYREIMLSLGYKNNKIPFLTLATLLPYAAIRNLKERKVIENALLYRAGLTEDTTDIPSPFDFSLRMPRSAWNYHQTRPKNRPEERITQISYLLADTVEQGIFNYFKEKIEAVFHHKTAHQNANNIVKAIMGFPKLGKERKNEVFFNIILPFYGVIFEAHQREIKEFLMDVIERCPLSKKDQELAQKRSKGRLPLGDYPLSFIEFWGILEQFQDG